MILKGIFSVNMSINQQQQYSNDIVFIPDRFPLAVSSQLTSQTQRLYLSQSCILLTIKPLLNYCALRLLRKLIQNRENMYGSEWQHTFSSAENSTKSGSLFQSKPWIWSTRSSVLSPFSAYYHTYSFIKLNNTSVLTCCLRAMTAKCCQFPHKTHNLYRYIQTKNMN